MARRSLLHPSVLYKAIAVCLLLVPFCTASDDWNYEESHDEVRDFVAGGMVHFRMSVGDLHITRSDTTKIRLHYTVKSRHECRLKEAHVDIDIRGRVANAEFHAPVSGNTQFDVELEVPQGTNLDVHQRVGDLTVENIEGDKDLELGVGDIRIAFGRTAYHLINASAGIGDVNGEGYGATSGWLGKTLKYHGEGKYELRAHVSVGDIHLERR